MRVPRGYRSWIGLGMAVVALCAAGVVVLDRATTIKASVLSDIDSYPARTKVLGCAKPLVGRPGVVAFRALVLSQVGGHDAGLAVCKRIANASGEYSDHADGRAWDWQVRASRPADRAKVNQVLDWLLRTDERGHRNAMARRVGITYIIWNHRYYRVGSDDARWVPYTGTSDPHDTHVHFSFSVAGADRQTSWWRERGPLAWPLPGRDAPLAFGTALYQPLGADWDGDGHDSPGGYNPSDRRFVVRVESATGPRTVTTPPIGPFGALPVAGDRDGRGGDEVGVYDPLAHRFSFYSLSGTPVGPAQVFGATGDLPIVGDWDGDGRADVGTYTPASRTFSRLRGDGSVQSDVFGGSGDTPLVGDWNGDGRDDIGVFQWATATFHLATPTVFAPERTVRPTGPAGARRLPVPGDWTGSGTDTPGIVSYERVPRPMTAS